MTDKFELHFTLDREFLSENDEAFIEKHVDGWKTSRITDDPVLGDGSRFYLTTYAPNRPAAHRKIAETEKWLTQGGFGESIMRMKIEHVVFDKIIRRG